MALKKTTPIIITSLVIIAFFLIDLLLIDYTYLSKFNHLASLSPLYSFYTPMLSWRLLAPIAAGALFIAFLARTEKQSLKVNIVGFVVFMIAIRACFYYLRHDFSAMSQELFPYPAEAMISDTSVIGRMGLFSFLSAYPDLMPQLSLHGSHFPPGHSVLLYLLMSVFGENPHAVGWALIVLSSSIVFPIIMLANRIFNDNKIAYAAAALLTIFPSSVIFGAVSLSALFAAIAIWPVYFAVSAMDSIHRKKLWLLTGAALGVCAFFSFAALPLGLFIFILHLIRYLMLNEKRVVLDLALILLGFISITFALYIFLDFNIIKCLLTAINLNRALIDRITMGTDRLIVYLYSSWGNLLAYCIGSGLVLMGLAVGSLCKMRKVASGNKSNYHYSIALFTTVVIIGVSGLFYLETERIWLFLSCLMVIPASGLLISIESKKLRLTLISLLFVQTLIQETLLNSLW